MCGFDLSGVVLRGAILRAAKLTGVDLEGAFLQGANLVGADLTNATNVATSVFDAFTKGFDFGGNGAIDGSLPDGFGVAVGGPAIRLTGGLNPKPGSLALQLNLVVNVDHVIERDFSFALPQAAAVGIEFSGSGRLTAGLALDVDAFVGIRLAALTNLSAPTNDDIYIGLNTLRVGGGVSVADLDLSVSFGAAAGSD